MNIEADLHVHTVASGHAYSTVFECAREASSKGIKTIALLDHGPALPGGAHEYYFSNLIDLPRYIHGVRVIKGVEANIISAKGQLDISDYTLELLEFVGISMHPNCGYESAGIVQNTDAVIKAFERPNVKMFCHPCVPGFEIDIEAVVEAAVEKGVLIEINNHSFSPDSFRFSSLEENLRVIEVCMEMRALVAVNSDAHFHQSIGEVDLAALYLKQAGFPEKLIVNISTERLNAFLYRLTEMEG